jgi:hypothetical protein
MARLETRVERLEQSRPGMDFVAAVIVGDEDESAAIERSCKLNGITRATFDAARHRTIVHVRFVPARDGTLAQRQP